MFHLLCISTELLRIQKKKTEQNIRLNEIIDLIFKTYGVNLSSISLEALVRELLNGFLMEVFILHSVAMTTTGSQLMRDGK